MDQELLKYAMQASLYVYPTHVVADLEITKQADVWSDALTGAGIGAGAGALVGGGAWLADRFGKKKEDKKKLPQKKQLKKKANPLLENVKKLWNENPALQYGVYGAGAGAGLGLASSLAGKKKRPLQSMLTGALGGAALGAGGKYFLDSPLGQQVLGKKAPTSNIDLAKQRMFKTMPTDPLDESGLASVAGGMSGGYGAPGAALGGMAQDQAAQKARAVGNMNSTEVLDWGSKNPGDTEGLPSSFLSAVEKLDADRKFDPMNIGIGAAGGAGAGAVGEMVLPKRRPLSHGQQQIDQMEKQPSWYKGYDRKDGPNRLAESINGAHGLGPMTAAQERAAVREAKGWSPFRFFKPEGTNSQVREVIPPGQLPGVKSVNGTPVNVNYATKAKPSFPQQHIRALAGADAHGLKGRLMRGGKRGGKWGAGLGLAYELARSKGWLPFQNTPAENAVQGTPGLFDPAQQ